MKMSKYKEKIKDITIVPSAEDKKLVSSLLSDTFMELRSYGLFARRRWTCCNSCGIAELPDNCNGFVFMHEQAEADFKRTGIAYLNYGETRDTADSIIAALEHNGLVAKWSGKLSQKIKVVGYWKGTKKVGQVKFKED
jgi:hypothetical protein